MARDSSEKHMGSYESHAWQDAMWISQTLLEVVEQSEWNIKDVVNKYNALTQEAKSEFDNQYRHLIAEYIKKTEGQRPAYFKKITKQADAWAKCQFLVTCIVGVVRAKEILELRDNYRWALAPGSGYRVTTQGAYLFASDVRRLFTYDWPYELFSCMGIDLEDLDDYEDENDAENVS